MLDHSTTAIISRGELWEAGFATEPYEAGWAKEAVIFLQALDPVGEEGETHVRLQISPDGILWVDEGTTLLLPGERDPITFAKVGHFGQFLRLMVAPGAACAPRRILATLSLK